MKAYDYYKHWTPRQTDLSDIPKSRVLKTIELVTKGDPNKILDVGCGSGVIPQLFKKGDNEVIGIEINKEQGDIANKRLDKVIIQDAEEKWNVPDNYFDVVHMGAFLEHIFDYHHALNEANRVLKQRGGKVVISVPNGACLEDRVRLLLGKQPRWYDDIQHIRFWTKNWLKEHLENHGFSDIRVIGDGFLIGLGVIRYNFNIVDKILTFIEHHFPGICNVLMVQAIKTQEIKVGHELIKR